MHPSQCRFQKTLLLLSCVAFVGCSHDDGRLKVISFSGKVTSNGQPAEGVIIQFVPSEGSAAHQAGLYPGGVSDTNGTYKLTTYRTDDGAPEGDYLVRLYWPGPPKEPSSDPVKEAIQTSNPFGGPQDRFQFKYWKKPEANPWSIVVSKDSPTAQTIELPLR